MRPGDEGGFWRYYSDRVRSFQLGAAPAKKGILARNQRLSEFLAPPGLPSQLPEYYFLPLALSGGIDGVATLEAWSTGGRSFLLTPESLERIGWPERLYLDLGRLGWGSGLLEVRFEIKGAGTTFARSRVNPEKLAAKLAKHPRLRKSYQEQCEENGTPALFSSRAMYESRNMGGQREDYAIHSTRASELLLGRSAIRFAPTLFAIAQTPKAHENLRIVSGACDEKEALYNGRVANEVRCTPSTVRGVYLDRAGSDEVLEKVCSRISSDPAELEATVMGLAGDVRRYFEHLAQTTRYQFDPTRTLDREVFTWLQFGDIWVTFERDESGRYVNAEEYRHDRRVAWYLAKDEVIVRGVGRMFVDMECLRNSQVAHNFEELRFQHGLFVLNVLRDHNRVATQLRVGLELLRQGYISRAARKELHQLVMREMAEAVNAGTNCSMDMNAREISVSIQYEHLSGAKANYRVPREQIAEIYV